MKKPGIILVIIIFVLAGLGVKVLGQNTSTVQTQFGTIANFRQYSGSPNFTDGKVYSGVDSFKILKNEMYHFIGPDGQPVAESNNPGELLGKQPDTATRQWWIYQLNQMVEAGLDFVLIDNFGKAAYDCDDCSEATKPGCKRDSHNSPSEPEFQGEALKKLFHEEHSQIQVLLVGLYVESNAGPYHHYNWDRFRAAYGTNWCQYKNFPPGQSTDPLHIAQAMPFTPANALHYFYKDLIYPFYSHFNDDESRRHWLTHNGRSLKGGGRPVIFFYGANPAAFSNFDQAGAAFEAIKKQFQADFGVVPFFVIEENWLKCAHNDPALLRVADATESFLPEWLFGSKNPPGPNSWVLNGYRISRIVPGLKAPQNHWGGKGLAMNPLMGKRWMYVDGSEGPDESYFLNREWQSGIKNNPNLAIIGHWDDLEGENITRMSDYEKKDGGYLPPDYYIKKVRALINNYYQTGH